MRSLWKAIYKFYPFTRGKGRLLDFVRRRLTGKMLFNTTQGTCYFLDLDNLIDCITYLDGCYESDELLALEDVAMKHGCDCFIDVGANIGNYSLHFSANRTFVQLWAFEPDPRNFGQLSANLWLNDASARVWASKLALSSKTGRATFFVNKPVREKGGPQFNTGTSSLVRESPHHCPITVETATLDSLLNLCNRRILVKIDVEGAEQQVLEGAVDLLRNNLCVLMIEIWNDLPERAQRIQSLLAQVGYEKIASPFGGENFLFISGSFSQPSEANGVAQTCA